uniref:Retrovirus-related Pol polyprotein from transposon 17.6 n=1 Tax=Schistocephalus solidus TaxID=70667 RepID=A0A0X3PJI7_SCHSO
MTAMSEPYWLFIRHFCGRQFSSYDELQNCILEFQKAVRLVYVKRGTNRLKVESPDYDRLRYSRIRYACKHSDACRNSSSTSTSRRTYKCGCPSFFEVRQRAQCLTVTKFNMSHNHSTEDSVLPIILGEQENHLAGHSPCV